MTVEPRPIAVTSVDAKRLATVSMLSALIFLLLIANDRDLVTARVNIWDTNAFGILAFVPIIGALDVDTFMLSLR